MNPPYTPPVELPADLRPETLDIMTFRGSANYLILHSGFFVTVPDEWGIEVNAYEIESFALAYETGLTEHRHDGYQDCTDQVMRCMIDPDLWFVKRHNNIDYFGTDWFTVHDNTPEADRPEGSSCWNKVQDRDRYVIKTKDGYRPVTPEALKAQIKKIAAEVLEGETP